MGAQHLWFRTAEHAPSVAVLRPHCHMQQMMPVVAITVAFTTTNNVSLLHAQACAIQIIGALASILDRTSVYARERRQFNRAILEFQAVQQQLAIMAEHLLAARMAVEWASPRAGVRLDPLKVAITKARTSAAAVEISALAHAIHGATGITEEFDHATAEPPPPRLAGGRWHRGAVESTNCINHKDSSPRSLDLLRRATALT